MIKSLLLIFVFSFYATANDCQITLAHKVYTYQDQAISYNHSGCNYSQQEVFKEIISYQTGQIGLRTRAELRNNSIDLKPSSIIIIRISESIKNQFSIPSDWRVRFKQSHKSLNVSTEDNMEISCTNCSSLGNKKVSLTLNGVSRWLDIIVEAPVKAVVIKKEINLTHKPIKKADVELRTVYTTNAKSLYKNIDNITFYKANKPLSKGHALKHRDLSPINLVTYGTPVKVVLQNNNIKLTTQGTPMGTGRLEDYIKIKNTKTKKVYTAKIIGRNTVRVEL